MTCSSPDFGPKNKSVFDTLRIVRKTPLFEYDVIIWIRHKISFHFIETSIENIL